MSGSRWGRGVRQFMAAWSVFAFGVLPLAGCTEKGSNADSQTLITETASGIRILEVARNEARRSVYARVSTAGQERRVSLTRLDEGPQGPGITARITNEAGTESVELSIAADPVTGEMWWRAQAGTDVVAASVRRSGTRVHESYEINGDLFEVDYPALPAEQMEKALARHRAGTLGRAVSADLREIESRLTAFDEFVNAHPVPALSENSDGAVLVDLLGDPAFAGLVTGDPIDPLRTDGLDRRVCLLLSLCVTFSCGNPVLSYLCIPCAGGLIGCVIVEILCWFIGCDCCF